jgi:hypothetical protein
MTKDVKDKIEQIKRKVLPILVKHGIKKAGVFGSVVRGTDKRDSDVDFLVEFSDQTRQSMSLFDLMDIEEELEQVLGKKIDLVQYDLIKPALKEYILPAEVRIYEENS